MSEQGRNSPGSCMLPPKAPHPRDFHYPPVPWSSESPSWSVTCGDRGRTSDAGARQLPLCPPQQHPWDTSGAGTPPARPQRLTWAERAGTGQWLRTPRSAGGEPRGERGLAGEARGPLPRPLPVVSPGRGCGTGSTATPSGGGRARGAALPRNAPHPARGQQPPPGGGGEQAATPGRAGGPRRGGGGRPPAWGGGCSARRPPGGAAAPHRGSFAYGGAARRVNSAPPRRPPPPPEHSEPRPARSGGFRGDGGLAAAAAVTGPGRAVPRLLVVKATGGARHRPPSPWLPPCPPTRPRFRPSPWLPPASRFRDVTADPRSRLRRAVAPPPGPSPRRAARPGTCSRPGARPPRSKGSSCPRAPSPVARGPYSGPAGPRASARPRRAARAEGGADAPPPGDAERGNGGVGVLCPPPLTAPVPGLCGCWEQPAAVGAPRGVPCWGWGVGEGVGGGVQAAVGAARVVRMHQRSPLARFHLQQLGPLAAPL